MYAKQTRIVNSMGLHARPASKFVLKAKEFQAQIFIRNLSRAGTQPANAKSIVSILAGGMRQGAQVEVTADGSDAREAVEALTALIESGFGEA